MFKGNVNTIVDGRNIYSLCYQSVNEHRIMHSSKGCSGITAHLSVELTNKRINTLLHHAFLQLVEIFLSNHICLLFTISECKVNMLLCNLSAQENYILVYLAKKGYLSFIFGLLDVFSCLSQSDTLPPSQNFSANIVSPQCQT